MIGSSVVPGLPKICATPSAWSSSTNAARPLIWLVASCRASALPLAGAGRTTTPGAAGPAALRRRGERRHRDGDAVQLSEKASAQVLNGRPSRSRGQGRPAAWTPLCVSRAPSAGIRIVQTP